MRALVYTLLLATTPGALAAQAGTSTPDRIDLSAGAAAGLIVGDDSDFLDGGLGPWAAVRWQSGSSAFGWAGTLTWLRLEDDLDELTGARAANALFTVLAGPTVNGELGPVRPWLGAFAGVVGVRWTQETPRRTAHGTDTSLGWRIAGGAAIPLSGGVALEAEAGVTGAGTLPFARAPSPDTGGVTGLIRRDVALLSLRLGIRVGL